MPSPLDVPAIKGIDPDTERRSRETTHLTSEPFAALAFKIATDPFVGKLCFLPCLLRRCKCRVTQSLMLLRTASERFGRIVQMHCKPQKGHSTTVYSGDIAAAVGLKNTTTGDTLCDEKHPDYSRIHGIP